MTYTYSDELFSDLHKDAYGCRPSVGERLHWQTLTADEKQAEWERLCDILESNEVRRSEMEEAAVAAFETQVRENIELGAGNRETAIRWIVQSGGWENEYDPGYICYCLGLPYSMESVFKPFIGQEAA